VPLRVVIADDERPARAFVAALVRDFDDVEIVGEGSDGAEAVALIERERPDLALLDLQMPELDGLEVVRLLDKNHLPLVAFVTAHDEYAVRAFELNAVDYLLKPVTRARLAETLTRARERLEHDDLRAEEIERLERASRQYEEERGAGRLERIPVKKRDEIVLVPVERIASVESEGELLHITTDGGERHTITRPLKDLESRLDPDAFIRLSRGALARVALIESVSPMPGGTFVVTLRSGQKLPASRQRSKVLRERLLKF
jgi:two-component system LytT family response regulator